MNVALTGATGFIGSHVLAEFQEHGHEVTALVRDDAQADVVPPVAPSRPWSTSTTDRRSPPCSAVQMEPSTQPVPATPPAQPWMRQWWMPRSMRSRAPASRTSTSAVSGCTAPTRPSPSSPLSMHLRWCRGRNRSNADAQRDRHARSRDRVRCRIRRRGRRDSRTASGLAPRRRRQSDHARHGTTTLVDRPCGGSGRLLPPRVGIRLGPWLLRHRQRKNSTVAELTEAAAVAVGAPGAVPGSDDEARARLGDYFAEVLLLDQGTVAAKARTELGWSPTHPGLVDEFRHGSYRN